MKDKTLHTNPSLPGDHDPATWWNLFQSQETFSHYLTRPEIPMLEKRMIRKLRIYLDTSVLVIEEIEAIIDEIKRNQILDLIKDTVFSLDALVSWNFEHIVKLETKREVNVINILSGYNQLEIVEPTML